MEGIVNTERTDVDMINI